MDNEAIEIPAHAYIRPLLVQDVDKCLELEKLGFPDEEACTKEKLLYRLTVCPELSAGLFIRGEEKLIGHIIGTKMRTERVTDAAMDIPEIDESFPGLYRRKDQDDVRGHFDDGDFIGVHSVVIHPDYRGKRLGHFLLKDYMQRMATLHVGSKVSIIAHSELLPFYRELGFLDLGPSDCEFGGGNWIDLSADLIADDDD